MNSLYVFLFIMAMIFMAGVVLGGLIMSVVHERRDARIKALIDAGVEEFFKDLDKRIPKLKMVRGPDGKYQRTA